MESVYQNETVAEPTELGPQGQLQLHWQQQPGFLPVLRQKNVIDQNAGLISYAATASLHGWLSPGQFAFQGLLLVAILASLLNWQMTRHAGKLEDQITEIQTTVQTEVQRLEGIMGATQAEMHRIETSPKNTFNLHFSDTPLTREQALFALNYSLNESRSSMEQYKLRMAAAEQKLRARQGAMAIVNSGSPLIFALALIMAAGLVAKYAPKEFARSRQARRISDYYLYFATAEGLWPNLVLLAFLHIALSGNAYGIGSVFASVGPLFWVVFWIGFYFLLLRYFVMVARDLYQAMQLRLPANEWGPGNKMLLSIHNSFLLTFAALEGVFLLLCYGFYFAQR